MARHLNYYDCGWVSFVQIVIFLAPGSTGYGGEQGQQTFILAFHLYSLIIHIISPLRSLSLIKEALLPNIQN